MTRDQLLAIAQRHTEDHKYALHEHPRADTIAGDAVGDRGALLELLADLASGSGASLSALNALQSLRPSLKTPGLPHLLAPRPSPTQITRGALAMSFKPGDKVVVIHVDGAHYHPLIQPGIVGTIEGQCECTIGRLAAVLAERCTP